MTALCKRHITPNMPTSRKGQLVYNTKLLKLRLYIISGSFLFLLSYFAALSIITAAIHNNVPQHSNTERPVYDLPHLHRSLTAKGSNKETPTSTTNSTLLDFAVIGFPKCGTTTLLKHLHAHEQVYMFDQERCEMANNKTDLLIQDLKQNTNKPYTGLKCARDLESSSLARYTQYFPTTKLIIGIRHPVLWFESFYNFRIQNGIPMKSPNDLVGICGRGAHQVCTVRGLFHMFLSNLGKTNMTTPEELALLPNNLRKYMNPVQTPQRVFLYEISQLADNGEFLIDLQSFLGLSASIESLDTVRPGQNISGTELERRELLKIDICNPEYTKVRLVLQEQAKNTADWIVEYFLQSPDVVVSSREDFVEILKTRWHEDPCQSRNSRATIV